MVMSPKSGSTGFAFVLGVAITMLAANATPAAAQQCEVKLGVAGPMTGAAAAWGLAIRGGSEFEAAWQNANGGVQVGNEKCKVTVVSVDSQGSVAGGAAAANYLASQNVHLVIGPVATTENTGFKPVSRRNKLLNFTTTFALDAIGPDYPLSFQNQLPPQAWGPAYMKVVDERFKPKTVLLVAPNDQGGTDAGNSLLKYYNEAGIKGSAEWYQRGTMNFGAIATRVMSQNPDAVEMGPMPPGEGTNLTRQLMEAGFKGVVGRSGTGAEQIIKGMGGADKLNNMYWFEAVPTSDPGIVKMNEDYIRLMKNPLPENSLVYCGQLAAEQVMRAVTRAGTADDVEKVAASLRGVPPESRYLGQGAWRGKTMYNSNQQLAFPIGMGFIVDGKQQPLLKVPVLGE